MIRFAPFLLALLGPSLASFANADEARSGTLIRVEMPLDTEQSKQLAVALEQRVESENAAAAARRPTVVLRLVSREGQTESTGTDYEDALRLARKMGSPAWRRIRWVVWVDTPIRDHGSLLALAADQVFMAPDAKLSSVPEGAEDIRLTYGSISRKKAVFPEPLAIALADAAMPLSRVTTADNERQFLAGQALDDARGRGDLIREDVWSGPGKPLEISAEALREAQIASGIATDAQQVARLLDLASLEDQETIETFDAKGILVAIDANVSAGRVRRWNSSLAAIDEDVNLYFVTINSAGGNLDASATMAANLVDPPPEIRRSVGVVQVESRADAALIALACDPLYGLPDAKLGGPGADAMNDQDLEQHRELIELIAQRTGRSAGLIRGLLNPDREVYRYTDQRTGAVAYGTQQELFEDAADPQAEAKRWQRGDAIDLRGGLNMDQAIRLGLVDAIVENNEQAAEKVGLDSLPDPLVDRKLVRMVERFGNSQWVAFVLLAIGLSALSAEAQAPGLGFPGFLALVCFGLFFWIKFLAGTAEWFELIALVLGLVCIAVEVFLVPGTGIFGIGGLILLISGVVMMSQSFVLPQNEYQLNVLASSVWTALGGVIIMFIAFVGFRFMLPHVPLLRGLVMEGVDGNVLDQNERIADFGHLLGQTGRASTPIRPSGKANFDGEVIAVISDGSVIEKGDPVRVCEVHATRVVVEPAED
ncbi:MAG: NfeD family protein [Planctomycetota bacterium]